MYMYFEIYENTIPYIYLNISSNYILQIIIFKYCIIYNLLTLTFEYI